MTVALKRYKSVSMIDGLASVLNPLIVLKNYTLFIPIFFQITGNQQCQFLIALAKYL